MSGAAGMLTEQRRARLHLHLPSSKKSRLAVRTFSPEEAAEQFSRAVVLDCRPLSSFTAGHIAGAVHMNCTDRLARRRLVQENRLWSLSGLVIVYDEGTVDPDKLPPLHPLAFLLASLVDLGLKPAVLKGGWREFLCSHGNMCTFPRSSASDNAATTILPFLYLGSERDSVEAERLQVTHVLNVTTHLPDRPEPGVAIKRIPASDNCHENLKQYFEECFQFIEDARISGGKVLVHCQAGVSRSPTIAIAYLLYHFSWSLVEAYSYVKNLRPFISPNLNFMGQLVEFEQTLRHNSPVSTPHTPTLESSSTALTPSFENVSLAAEAPYSPASEIPEGSSSSAEPFQAKTVPRPVYISKRDKDPLVTVAATPDHSSNRRSLS